MPAKPEFWLFEEISLKRIYLNLVKLLSKFYVASVDEIYFQEKSLN